MFCVVQNIICEPRVKQCKNVAVERKKHDETEDSGGRIYRPTLTIFRKLREKLSMLKMSAIVFWVVAPCGLLSGFRRFGGSYRLHLQTSYSVR